MNFDSYSNSLYTFNLFYQEANPTSFVVGLNTVTLPTPVKLTAGKFYVAFVIPVSVYGMLFRGWLHNPSQLRSIFSTK